MNSYIPPKDLLENLALFINDTFGELKHTMEICISLPKEEHYKLDNIFHYMFKPSVPFEHSEIINLTIEDVHYKFIQDSTLKVDNELKTDENGNTYI